jgi:hypothetical protein
MGWFEGGALLSRRCRLLICRCAGSVRSSAVDIFNASSGRWSTAALSEARNVLAGSSLPNLGLAIFAGGFSGFISLFQG